jgi:hypothetical protein
MVLLSVFLVLNTVSIFILGVYATSQSNEIYDLRARILELEMKELSKKSASLHRIK